MMSEPHMPKIDPEMVEDMILSLAQHGAVGETGVCRLVYTDAWQKAQAQVQTWAQEAGLTTSFDQVGNLWAKAEGQSSGPSFVTGSHIDSQRSGGRYDGALGVIAGLVAIKTLFETFGPPKRPLELVSLCEEESSRFPNAGFWGSRAIVGRSSPEDCEIVVDEAGAPISAAMRACGFDPARIGEVARNDIAGFIELHIEQGPILEDADLSVAVVDAITHIRHTEVTLTGVSNHAGAFPMDIRADPMAGMVEIAAAAIAHAEALGRPAVTTIGQCSIDPNAPAIIPRSVTFTIDARDPDPAAAKALHDTHNQIMDKIAAKRGLKLTRRLTLDHAPCQSDPGLLNTLQDAADAADIQTLRMASGAGHDAQQMSRICPVAMLFVRSKDGRSHTPEELSNIPDIVDGIQILAGALYRLGYS
ncbi:MAG: Zn-dependent hydrolase [Pseudomonadota bacterium]